MRYELLIFDADDTLFDFQKSEREALERCLKEAGLTLNGNIILSTFIDINLAIWRELEQGLISQQVLRVERFRRLKRKLNLQFDEEIVAKRYLDFLSDASYLFSDSEKVIKALASTYKLVLLSNGLSYVQNKRLRNSIIAPYFEDIIISEEVGYAKPDPRIFALTLERVNHFNKQNVLMIGDSLTSDILGGIEFGINTCWVNRKHLLNNTNIKPTYEVHDLIELDELLKSRE